MRNQYLLPLLGLWAAATTARSGQAQRLLEALRGRNDVRREAVVQDDGSLHARTSGPGPRFLNSGTRKFAVDGRGIPDVPFDVGESYAGLLPISNQTDERDHLFFWFFPTANKEHEHSKEIVIWLNGGPGCSSLLGFLQENGPIQWQAGTMKPVANPWSWHRLTNVIWVEQPVKVGFSKGQATIKNEDELAAQFLGFWRNLVDTFGMHGWKVYVAAESYGGYYGPYISSHMLDARDSRYFDLGGLLVYDGLMFNGAVQTDVVVEGFVEQHYELMPLDDAAMAHVHNVSQRCGFSDYHRKYLAYPPRGPAPRHPPGYRVLDNGTAVPVDRSCSSLFDYVDYRMSVINPCWNVYNIRAGCPQPFDPVNGAGPYFDRADVKMAINAPLDVQWSLCVDGVFNASRDQSLPPDKYELPNVIDRTHNVILAHGAFDYVLPLNGVLLGLQNMTWGGQLGFQTAPSDPFYVPLYGFDPAPDRPFYGDKLPAGSGVLGTTHHERGLTIVVTQLAGHEGPGYSAASALRHLEKLLGRVHSLSDKTPFTLPELRNVSQAEEPLGRGVVKIPCYQRGC